MGKKYKRPKVNARQTPFERRAKYNEARQIGWSSQAARRMRDHPYPYRCTPESCRDRVRW